jgi:hypothetical protein
VFIPCDPALRTLGRIETVVIPAVELATTIHTGPPAEIDRAYGALATHVAQHAVGVEGPIREYYLVDAHADPDPTTWRTQIGWPIFRTTAPTPGHQQSPSPISVDAEAGGSQHQTIARPKLTPAHPHAVYRRPVGRLEVLKHPAAVAEHEAGVPARYARIVEDDVAAVAAAHHQFGDAARPVERQQIRRLRPVVRTRRAEPIDRGEQTSFQAADRSPGHQVADEACRVDLTRSQRLVEAVQERVLAQQPLAVGGRQRLSDLPS